MSYMIHLSATADLAGQISAAAGKLTAIGTGVAEAASEISGSRDIFEQRAAEDLRRQSESQLNLAERMEKLSVQLSAIRDLYIRYDKAAASNEQQSFGHGGGGGFRESTATATDGTENDKQFLELLKSILGWADKTKTSDTAGTAKTGLSYLEALYRFFSGDMKGLTGAEDLCNLGDKSIGLWKGLYDYAKKATNGIGSLFSEENQKNVGALGVLGSGLGLVGSIFGAVDTINSTDNIGPAGVAGEILEAGSSAVDVWSSIEKWKHIGDAADTFTKSDGIYSPLSLYTTIAKGGLSAFAQGAKSVEKYSADGNWDIDDAASTGADFAVSGLYSMINGLSFGLISEKTTGASAESISTAMKGWAVKVGKGWGDKIVNDPQIYQAYQNASGIGRLGIAIYAALKW